MFHDRIDAGKQLLGHLKKYQKIQEGIIIAIPRGGLQIGAELSQGLSLPMDVFFAKKIGHPYNPEFAIGVVGIDSELIDQSYLNKKDISASYIQKEIKRIRASLIAREALYRKNFKPLSLKDKIVILTDDGVATGKTLNLILDLIKTHQPKKIVVAIPVGPPSVRDQLTSKVDEVIFLETPEDFFAISQCYTIFNQIEDDEAIQLLKDYHGNNY
jgi:predicted phosphoribosyltransferase